MKSINDEFEEDLARLTEDFDSARDDLIARALAKKIAVGCFNSETVEIIGARDVKIGGDGVTVDLRLLVKKLSDE